MQRRNRLRTENFKIYEYTDGSPDTLAMAVYPTGAWAINDTLGADANIIAQVRAALTAASVGNVVTATATATFTG